MSKLLATTKLDNELTPGGKIFVTVTMLDIGNEQDVYTDKEDINRLLKAVEGKDLPIFSQTKFTEFTKALRIAHPEAMSAFKQPETFYAVATKNLTTIAKLKYVEFDGNKVTGDLYFGAGEQVSEVIVKLNKQGEITLNSIFVGNEESGLTLLGFNIDDR